MLKYTDTRVTFSEVPDEVTLCINISGCLCHCEWCHSASYHGYKWKYKEDITNKFWKNDQT